MFTKTILAVAGFLASVSFSFAQTPPASAPTNAHKTHDQKARECRKAAAEKQLTGEELLAFMVTCVAPPNLK